MNTQIKISIENDYNSENSFDYWNNEIENVLTELDLYCEVKNSRFINPLENNNKTKDKKDYKNKFFIDAFGYSQSDWQTYSIYYNRKDTNLNYFNELINLLKKSFTHKNDYIITKTEVVTINNKTFESDAIDYTTFSITDIEFPDANEIEKCYIEWYGKDFDIIEINID